MKLRSVFSLAAAVLLSTAMMASAQNNNGGGAGGAGGGGGGRRGNRGGGNFDPAQMQQRREERLKTELKATDEEWTVLQPLIEKVTTAQQETRAGGFGGRGAGGGFGGRGNRGGQAADQNAQGAPAANPPAQNATAAATQDLRTALQNDGVSPADIKTKLAAVRAARKKGETDLATARENLKKVLTQRQEAVLVIAGILE